MSQPLALPQIGSVDIWIASLNWSEQALSDGLHGLSSEERTRAAHFIIDKPRNDYIAAHRILRDVLARYLGCPSEAVVFTFGEHGKPFVAPSFKSALQFNMTHSHESLAIAISQEAEVGIDIEFMKERPCEELAQRFFAKEESEALLALPEAERYEAFFRCWTRKEAFMKVEGSGLSFGLSNFCVSLANDGMDCLLTVNQDAKLAQRWSLGSIEVCKGYAAAISMVGKLKSLNYHHWEQCSS